jgi:hypothetical protein
MSLRPESLTFEGVIDHHYYRENLSFYDVISIFHLISAAYQKPKVDDFDTLPQSAAAILKSSFRKCSAAYSSPTIFPLFPVKWWWMFMMISQRLTVGGSLNVKDSNKFGMIISKRIAGEFVRMSQQFFAEVCFYMGRHQNAWDLFSDFCKIPRDHAAISRNPKPEFPKRYLPSLIQAYLCVVPGEKPPNCVAAFEIAIQFHLLPFLRGEKEMSENEWKFFLEIMQMIMQTQKNSAIEFTSLVDNCADCDVGMTEGPTSHDDIVFYLQNVEFLKEVYRLLQLLDRLIQAV